MPYNWWYPRYDEIQYTGRMWKVCWFKRAKSLASRIESQQTTSKIEKSRNSLTSTLFRNTGSLVSWTLPLQQKQLQFPTAVAWEGANLWVKSGAGLCCFLLQGSQYSDSPNHIPNIQLHKKFLLLPLHCLTRHLVSFKNNHWDLFSLWTAEYCDERGPIQSSSKLNYWQVLYRFFLLEYLWFDSL